MIELIDGAPAGALAFKAVGEVRADDSSRVLKPELERVLAAGGEVHCAHVMGPEITGYSAGAAWEDAGIGLAHFTRWERCAVVTDTDRVRHLVRGFGWMMPGSPRLFAVDELPATME